MTDDTGQPTVDRLGALEAALRQVDLLAAEMGHSDTLGVNEAQERILEITTPLLAALDAASPLTTPTPDKGALERATRAFYGCNVDQNDIDSDSADASVIERIIDALTAAASEARAAERKAVLEIIADVRRRYAPATAASAALDYAAHRIECALATPEQSET